MLETVIARRYARALLSVVLEDGGPGPARERLDALGEAVRKDAELRDFLANPNIDPEHKDAALDAALDLLDAGEAERSFARVVCRAHRAGLLPEIADAFARLANEVENVLIVRVETAEPLAPEVETRLRDLVAKRTGKDVRLRVAVNPALIGGLTLRIENSLIDGTLRGRVEQMRRMIG